MIIGFSKHGTGGGRGPTEYMVDSSRKGRESDPPTVLRGNPAQTKELIDSLSFKHKYTSGVLSFAPGEKISPETESKIMDRFEKVAFAGLNQDQYNILWVRHTHAGHHELHFVTPRVELSTGKSMNIRPPGEKTKQHFDDFRSEINAKYGLADPTDPSRVKQVSTPDYELKIASEALRSGQKPTDNMRELLDEVLTKRAVQGLIGSREELLENVKELGFDVPRAGKNYITVADSDTGQRWRLKGGLYERDFEPSRTIEKAERARIRDFSKADEHAASRYAERVEQHIAARAGYNQSRFGGIEQNLNVANLQKQNVLAVRDGPEPLSGFISQSLGGSVNMRTNSFKQ